MAIGGIVMAKHLSYDDRLEIEKYLKLEHSLSEISRRLNRHKSTISREIQIRSELNKKGCYGHSYNACIYRYDCVLNNICKESKCKKTYKYCRFCGYCNDSCEYFREKVCEKLESPPYVCNGCEDRNKCTLTKWHYSAKTAQRYYEGLLVESRSGIECSPEELNRLNKVISPLVNQGQSIHHIHANNKDTIMVSERTIYNYIE